MATGMFATLVIASDGTAVDDTYTAVRPFRVIDAFGIVTNQVASTTTVQRQALGAGALNDVSSAITDNAAAGTLARTASVAPAQAAFVATDVMQFTSSGLGRQRMFVEVIPDDVTV